MAKQIFSLGSLVQTIHPPFQCCFVGVSAGVHQICRSSFALFLCDSRVMYTEIVSPERGGHLIGPIELTVTPPKRLGVIKLFSWPCYPLQDP